MNQEIDPNTGMPVEPMVNRAGTLSRSINDMNSISSITDPGMQSNKQAQAFQKFNNIAQYTPPPTAMLSSEQSAKMDTDNDGDIDSSDLETLRNNK